MRLLEGKVREDEEIYTENHARVGNARKEEVDDRRVRVAYVGQ